MKKLRKFQKIFGNFGQFLAKKMAGHKTPNFRNFRKFLLKKRIKHFLWGDIKLQKFLGTPLVGDLTGTNKAKSPQKSPVPERT